MPRSRFQFELQNDFTGGLNVGENPQHLAANEFPDVKNLDPLHRGGLRLRGAILAEGGALSNEAVSLYAYERTAAATQLIHADGVGVYYRTSGTWTAVDATYPGDVSFTVFKDRLYMANGNASHYTQRWDGSTLNALGDTDAASPNWNNDITSPTASGSVGNAPVGKHLATWRGVMWIGNTLENDRADAHPNRIRWSHPNWPEDWYERHYIDVDEGRDGDYIVGLVPAGDHLLVFKQQSVHAIYGNPPEGFSVVTLTNDIGAVSEQAIVSSDQGIFFFSWPNGVFRYNGKSFDWLWERLYSLIEDGSINASYADDTMIGWGNRRLWVSTVTGSETTRCCTFVMDPRLGKEGAWTWYKGVGLGPFVEWKPPGEDAKLISNSVGNDQLVTTDNYGTTADDFGSGDVHIDSYVVTPFVDLGSSVAKKKWGRPQFQLYGGAESTIYCTSYQDYDDVDEFRTFQLYTTLVGDGAVWDTDDWDDGLWGNADGANATVVEYGPPLGTAYAVALKVEGPKSENVGFGLDAITWKYIPRKIRN